MSEKMITSLTFDEFIEIAERSFGKLDEIQRNLAEMIFDDVVARGRKSLKGIEYWPEGEAMEAPMEPKTPCRQMETRPCTDLTVDFDGSYRVLPCEPGGCTRHMTRDRREMESGLE